MTSGPERDVADRVLEAIGSTPDGVFAVDASNRIVFWNRGAQSLLGHESARMLGRLCYKTVAGRDLRGKLVCQRSCADLTLARSGALVPSKEMTVSSRGGGRVCVGITSIPVMDDNGKLFAVAHILRPSNDDGSAGFLSNDDHAATERLRLLTRREREVLRHLVDGVRAASIAGMLGISEATVRKHVQRVLGKLEVHCALEAVALATGRSDSSANDAAELP